jgi:hypothetical protein
LICRLFDLRSTMKTRVLCSSIFFIADSVFSGLYTVASAPRKEDDWRNEGKKDDILLLHGGS